MGEIKNLVEQPVENVIYQNLKDIREKKNKTIMQNMKELRIMYNEFLKETEVGEAIQFHDTNRFKQSNFDSSLFKKYHTLHKLHIDKVGKAKNIERMYHKILDIVNEIKDDVSINYAVYFDKGGKIYRSFTEEIPSKALKLNTAQSSTTYEMQIYAKVFKEWAMVKSQKRALDVTDHFNTFLKTLEDTYNGPTPLLDRSSPINKGHVAEAFERHLQNAHSSLIKQNEGSLPAEYDWTVDEAWRLIRISLGNDPWYTGGDVKNIQVKTLFAGDRRVTTYNTIEDMFNFLEYLLKGNTSEEVLRRKAKEAFNVFYNKVDDALEKALEQTAEEIVNDIIKHKEEIKKINSAKY